MNHGSYLLRRAVIILDLRIQHQPLHRVGKLPDIPPEDLLTLWATQSSLPAMSYRPICGSCEELWRCLARDPHSLVHWLYVRHGQVYLALRLPTSAVIAPAHLSTGIQKQDIVAAHRKLFAPHSDTRDTEQNSLPPILTPCIQNYLPLIMTTEIQIRIFCHSYGHNWYRS